MGLKAVGVLGNAEVVGVLVVGWVVGNVEEATPTAQSLCRGLHIMYYIIERALI